MKLYLLRHADALPVGAEGIPRDEDRPLSETGRNQARRAAAGLSRWKIAIDGILTSPLPRARQTARIVAERIGAENGVMECEELAPGADLSRVVRLIASRAAEERILLVGHLPTLGLLVSLLVWGKGAPEVPFRKTGLACLTVLRLQPSPSARLEWILTPDHYPE